MEITSIYFGLSTIAAIIIFYFLKSRYRLVFLVTISCAFIASYSYYLLVYILFYTTINFYFGLKIPLVRNKKLWFRMGLVLNLLQLVILRYASFAIDPVFKVFNANIGISVISDIIVPIGISYFTLQGIGYLINVKMGWEKPERNYLDFLLYIVFFPKFLSGPIERSNHFLPQLKAENKFDGQQVTDGLRIALFGFFKKIAIANQIAPFLTRTYANLDATDGSSLWLLLIIQPLYLYFDFSGYTDIAIGFSKSLGINLLPNFNKPFFAENVTNFWKRFHISLSSWFNDYVFKQASFKYRKWGIYASIYALLLTWTLFGIWHGAGWNFMVLGLIQALALIYEFFTKKIRVKLFSGVPGQLRVWIGRVITYLFYGVSLVFFFSPDLDSAFGYFIDLFNVNNSFFAVAYVNIPLSAYAFMIVFMLYELVSNDYPDSFKKLDGIWSGEKMVKRLTRWVLYSLMLSILFVLGNDVQKFIYAQF